MDIQERDQNTFWKVKETVYNSGKLIFFYNFGSTFILKLKIIYFKTEVSEKIEMDIKETDQNKFSKVSVF